MQELSVETMNETPSKHVEPIEMTSTGERLVTSEYGVNMMEHLHRYAIALDLCDDKVVLDIASGEGYGSLILAGRARKVYGVDISNEAVEHASKKYQKPNLKFLQGRADAIPLADNQIELAVSFETIEHHDLHDEMMSGTAPRSDGRWHAHHLDA